MRRFLSTGSARSAKLAEGSARGATARKIGWLCRALPGSPYSPRPNGRGFFFAFGPEYAVQFFLTFPCSLQVVPLPSFCEDAGKEGARRNVCRKRLTRLQTACKGDDHAKIETPFLRFRGRLGFGRRHASDRLPPLASSSASSGRRSSRRFGQTRSRFGRSRRTSRSRFRRASWAWLRRTSRSPLTENF